MLLKDNGYNYIYFSKLETSLRSAYRSNIFYFLYNLIYEYPFFTGWYKNLFGNENNIQKEREIIVCEYKSKIVGVAILKATKTENKICTLRVAEDFRRIGIGKELFNRSLEWLEDEKPLITIHKRQEEQFSHLLNYFDFKLEQKKLGYYSLFSTEFVYNGELKGRNIVLNKLEKVNLEETIRKKLAEGSKGFIPNLKEAIDRQLTMVYKFFEDNNNYYTRKMKG